MPTFTADQLHTFATRILVAKGTSAEDAEVVAGELRDANLAGHDSHGVIRLMQYMEMVDDGFVKLDAGFDVVLDKPAFAVVDGNFHFGQVTATKALDIAREKAKAMGTSTVFVRNCNHVGRLGSYAEKAARDGFAAQMCVNAPGPGRVVPFGSCEGKLGTNPISMAAPWDGDALLLDMTSSATAEGKVRVAFQAGKSIPDGWILDAEGNPSTNPADLYGPPAGSILPLGGAMAHKGFGLSVMIDVFGGMLSGSGVCRTDLPRGANGVWMYLVDVEQFLPRDEFDALMETYVANIKGSKRLPGVDEIYLPGEIERRRREDRLANGIEVPDETWRQLNELAAKLGTSLET